MPQNTEIARLAESPPVAPSYHYFAYSFSFISRESSMCGSVYLGHPDQRVTLPRIERAKRQAGMPPTSVLVGLSYMGFMTAEEVRAPEPLESREEPAVSRPRSASPRI